ncbi:condensation domain-containing protein, partial [Streptomyces murinus]|uniref:condensation domain-containing protein n=1 Tax=Streptomyces murinus TaxID=33900 RepID=UPI002115BDCB
PLFQTALAFQNNNEGAFELPGLQVTTDEVRTGTAKFDLSFALREEFAADGAPAGIDGELEYALDLFDPETAGVLVERLLLVLRALATDPDTPIGAAEILTPGERERVLYTWNDTAREQQPAGSLPDLFRAQVARTPDAVAVNLGDEHLTYAGLDARSNVLANQLISRGVRSETPVAL